MLPARESAACSVLGDYVRPTNFELVQMADAIAVARAVKQISGDSDATVRFRTLEAIKGTPPAEFDVSWGRLGKPVPTDPEELAEPNAEAFAGPCVRTTFAKGKSYVIFLARDDEGAYRQLNYPFTRANEDYFGPDSLWVRTIRTYLQIQGRDSAMQQLSELERLMKLKSAASSERDRKQAADILDHLRSRSPFKPTEYLVETYEALERGETPRYAVRPPSADQEKSVAQALTDAMFGIGAPDVLDRAQEMQFVLTSLVNGKHPAARPLFDRLIAKEPTPPRTLGLALRFFAKNGDFERAFSLLRTHALSMLPLLSAPDAHGLVFDMAIAMDGEDLPEGEEPWRKHPDIRAQWPEMALGLYWYQYHAFGEDRMANFDDELGVLPIADYRSRPELALALAQNFDEKVEAWAIAELSDEAKRQAFEAEIERVEESRRRRYQQDDAADGDEGDEGDEADDDAEDAAGDEVDPAGSDDDEGDEGFAGENEAAESGEDPALLPLQALVLSFGDERDEVLLRVFCQSEERRTLLIEVLGEWAGNLDDDLVERIAASPQLTAEQREELGKAIASAYGREVAAARRFGTADGWLPPGEGWYELLQKLTGGEPVDARPIECRR